MPKSVLRTRVTSMVSDMSQNGSQGSPPDLHAVLDTNILIHFLLFIEIDWPKVLGAKHVC